MKLFRQVLTASLCTLGLMVLPAMASASDVDLKAINPRVDENMRLLFSARNMGTEDVVLSSGTNLYYYVEFVDTETGLVAATYTRTVPSSDMVAGAKIVTTVLLTNDSYGLPLEDGHTYKVTVSADWGFNGKRQNLVTETNESNNSASTTFTFYNPDLEVKDASLSSDGSNLVLTYTLSNNSTASVPYKIGSNSISLNGTELESIAWSSSSTLKSAVQAGASEELSYEIGSSAEIDWTGTNTVLVCVDAENAVAELNEENNCTEAEISFDAADLDSDGDGLSDDEELAMGTYTTSRDYADPFDSDTDDDGLSDGEEVNTYGTMTNDGDTDGDLLGDYDEVMVYGTDPLDMDTDDDGRTDKMESAYDSSSVYWSNPLDSDTDDDGLLDGEEDDYGTHRNEVDTDGDTYSDGDEVYIYGTDPRDADTDGDRLDDNEEIEIFGTDPLVVDTDGNGVEDGEEDADGDGLSNSGELSKSVGTNPLDADTDDDGLNDGDELNTYRTEPLIADTDADGLSDGDEVMVYMSNPKDDDTDSDGLTDGEEVNAYGTSALLEDTDGDGWWDIEEILDYGTDPLDASSTPDSDGDSYLDMDELALGSDPMDASSIPDWVTDEDGDGLSYAEEYYYGTSDLLVDTDGDGVTDLDEVMAGRDPLNPEA